MERRNSVVFIFVTSDIFCFLCFSSLFFILFSLSPHSFRGKRDEWLFNVPSPRMKFEWSNEFENINLRMSVDNNPGWYLQEENIYEHEVVNLQRALPLVASVQPLFMINADTSVRISRS